MYKKSFLVVLVLCILGLASCDNSKKFEENENGLKYKIHTKNEGPRLKEGEVVSIIFTMKNSKDSVFNSFLDAKNPFVIPVRTPPYKGSIDEGLFLLTKGDSATFLLNSDSLFKGSPALPFIEKGSDIVFDVKILNVQSPETYQKEKMEELQKDRERIEKESVAHVAIDDSLIRSYVAANKIAAQKTASGLYYVIDKQGNGPKPAVGDSVKVSYKGMFLNGKVFDSSEGKPAFNIPIGVGAVIPGWDEGIRLFNEGSKGRLFIPSALAYREQQLSADSEPFSVLVFEVEIHEVSKKK